MSQEDSQAKKIANTRLMRERQEIDSVLREYEVQWTEGQQGVEVKLNVQESTKSIVSAEIKLDPTYPFCQPLIRFHLSPSQTATFNHDVYKEIDYFCCKTYTPKMTVASIIPMIAEYGRKNISLRNEQKNSTVIEIIEIIYSSLGKEIALFTVGLFAILIRILVGLGSYSGYKDGPTYGDYEAQRHWMELTLNTPPSQWYVETLNNDITYWRIDYPPLSAYVSYAFGYLSNLFDPASMELFHSRGYETPNHKIFMRMTVLFSEIIFLIPSLYLVVQRETNKYGFQIRILFFLLALIAPPFILIDHAHFQYNAFMHGLVLWALHFVSKGQLFVGGILFSLALNFKQMGLYYSLAFFAYILGYLAIDSGFKHQRINKYNFKNITQYLFRIAGVGVGVILTFYLMWLPWVTDSYLLSQFLSAIFPVHRGLYQLKVANFWCFSNIFIKWTQVFEQNIIISISILLTLLACLPSMFVIFQRPKFKYLKLALFNISMSFFFFSYHVHEKTILLPLLPLTLCIRQLGNYYLDFVSISCLTLYPLLREDNQTLSWFVLTIGHHLLLRSALKYLKSNQIIMTNIFDAGFQVKDDKVADSKLIKQSKEHNDDYLNNSIIFKLLSLSDLLYFKIVRKAIYSAAILSMIAEQFVIPPVNYPYLFPLFYAVIGFGQFAYLFLQTNLLMVHQFMMTKTKTKVIQQKQD